MQPHRHLQQRNWFPKCVKQSHQISHVALTIYFLHWVNEEERLLWCRKTIWYNSDNISTFHWPPNLLYYQQTHKHSSFFTLSHEFVQMLMIYKSVGDFAISHEKWRVYEELTEPELLKKSGDEYDHLNHGRARWAKMPHALLPHAILPFGFSGS